MLTEDFFLIRIAELKEKIIRLSNKDRIEQAIFVMNLNKFLLKKVFPDQVKPEEVKLFLK